MSYMQQEFQEIAEAVSRAPDAVKDEVTHIRFMIIALRAHRRHMTARENNELLDHWRANHVHYVTTLLDTLIEALIIIQEALIADNS